jgi:hypothetical protein
MGIRTKHNVNVIGLKMVQKDPDGHETQKMDYVGFEKTKLRKEHSLLVIGKEEDLEDLVKENGKV